ncbi:retropepsin-like aspartic protease [Vibrio penaeicida]|uniref:retropepsin-like aspartic protease n=1 Tax=Vibrio penaeicida TaxID=104609 RepID=UPI002733D354|nr:retropepsin-like aspartic protease [Vibrio penaeicida]MDP2572546.1 retropepsin-like aspartic protease [Vibrio penaeicida]
MYLIYRLSACFRIFMCFFLFSAPSYSEECHSFNTPISFTPKGMPVVTLEIGEQEIDFLLDTGSSAGLHLPKSMMINLKGTTELPEKRKSMNAAGKEFSNSVYRLKTLKLGCMEFEDLELVALQSWGVSVGEGKTDTDELPVIGLGLFSGKTVQISFQDKELSIVNSDQLVSKQWPALGVYKEGIGAAVETKNQPYTLVLDTGASNTVFVRNKVNPKESLEACRYNLGNIPCQLLNEPMTTYGYPFTSKALLFPIDSRFQLDGLLGVDFFHQFDVQLDFTHNKILVKPAN